MIYSALQPWNFLFWEPWRNIIKFITNYSPQFALNVGYDGKCIEESVDMKLLGLLSDNHLNCTNHTDKLIVQLHRTCYAVRSMCHIINTDTLTSIYFAYFQLIMKYAIIFWSNSSNSKRYSSYKRNRMPLSCAWVLEMQRCLFDILPKTEVTSLFISLSLCYSTWKILSQWDGCLAL
jgi:hypothetical protein